jgi:energy-coupling factor transport system permease protein
MTGLARQAHPFTTGAVALALASLGVLAPAPAGTAVLYATTVALALVAGAARGVWLALLISGPLWVLLFVMHGILGEGPRVPFIGGGTLSAEGLDWAIGQGARLGAIVTASLAFAVTFDPHRFLQAAIARRWPWPAAFLVVATLDAADRFGAQARRLREAQRTRGLRVRGSLWTRARAVPALAFPLMLAALTEADEHALALETRGLTLPGQRTALDPPPDTQVDRVVRWAALVAVLAAVAWRIGTMP